MCRLLLYRASGAFLPLFLTSGAICSVGYVSPRQTLIDTYYITADSAGIGFYGTVRVAHHHSVTQLRSQFLRAPYWALSLVFGGGVACRIALRPAPLPPHLCRVCGYDLRATKERCPECGTAPDDAIKQCQSKSA